MISPIRREILVKSTPEHAFELFTRHINNWWPLASYSVYGNGTVALEDKELIERSGDRQSVWAEVIEWEPPVALRLNWHPGSTPDTGTDLRVTFTADGEETLVRIDHSGWERHPAPAAAAEEYGNGWPGVLVGFAAFAVQQKTAAQQ